MRVDDGVEEEGEDEVEDEVEEEEEEEGAKPTNQYWTNISYISSHYNPANQNPKTLHRPSPSRYNTRYKSNTRYANTPPNHPRQKRHTQAAPMQIRACFLKR